ncbi:hypothetical protein HERIO_1353 [Hepatospora eriocheir]|uniref:Uncharacterized protein n=1 Tax=Hepatospora eriocheir TaxID=1081669 RepID=A0A1X0QAK9_9MICR|nr:hypothetical protein HERIO_1353 [Hepatospora eriocheir]
MFKKIAKTEMKYTIVEKYNYIIGNEKIWKYSFLSKTNTIINSKSFTFLDNIKGPTIQKKKLFLRKYYNQITYVINIKNQELDFLLRFYVYVGFLNKKVLYFFLE